MQKKSKMAVIGNGLQDAKLQKFDNVFSVLIFLYCAMLPFEEALASSFGSVLRLLGILVVGYCVCMYSRYRVKVRNLKLLIPFVLWMIFSMVSVLWSNDVSWWIYFIQIYFFQLIFVVFLVAYYERINIRFVENGLIVGSLIASSILIFLPELSQITEEGRRTVVVFEHELDPNIVACIIMLGIFAGFRRVFDYQYRGIINKLLLFYLGIGMLFTGSRGALISFVIGFGILLFCEMRKRESKKAVFVLLIVAIIAAIAAIYFIPQELLESRFSSDNLFGVNEYEQGSHNRYTIWMNALKLFKDSPIIGYGCGNFFSAIATVYKECASHNMYILILIEEGILGLLIMVYGLVKMSVYLYKKQLYTLFAMFMSVCVMAVTLDSITTKYFWLVLAISNIAILKSNNRVREN